MPHGPISALLCRQGKFSVGTTVEIVTFHRHFCLNLGLSLFDIHHDLNHVFVSRCIVQINSTNHIMYEAN